MDKQELHEEIRAILREALIESSLKEWHYRVDELDAQIRSALRYLRTIGVDLGGAVMDTMGVLDPEPEEDVGVLVSYFVAHRLLTGDLIQKLTDGELGIYWKEGLDVIDTRDQLRSMNKSAAEIHDRYNRILNIILTGQVDDGASVYGEPFV